MENKIVDLNIYRIEKALKENGFTFKRDNLDKVKIMMRIKKSEDKIDKLE
jgi:hypothetical protein